MNIYFNNATDVLSFLLQTSNWNSWEVVKLQMTNSTGVSLMVNTQINDPAGLLDFQPLNRLQSMINTFMIENAGLTVTVDIKLRASKAFKAQIDPNAYYNNFYIDFFSSGATSMVSVTETETSLNVPSDPITNWESWVTTIATSWQKANNYGSTSTSNSN